MPRGARGLIAASAMMIAAPSAAEVIQSSPPGFVTQDRVTIAASPERTWSLLVRPSRWWNAEHSWSGNADNLALEPQAGGCFCETLPGGGPSSICG